MVYVLCFPFNLGQLKGVMFLFFCLYKKKCACHEWMLNSWGKNLSNLTLNVHKLCMGTIIAAGFMLAKCVWYVRKFARIMLLNFSFLKANLKLCYT